MKPQNDDQIERRLKELESEISLQHIPHPVVAPQPNRFQIGMMELKRVVKLAFFFGTGLVCVLVFSTAVSYVAIILGVVMTAGVGYLGYKLFFNRDRYR